ncbi:tyrosine-type recombinase/integrase [Nesterenkonia populi]|uniref:tyrosine-type recombinase/integrase n=1 Tax=Nesterenkonia populi TaxID=1591087 RepID=UPI0011BDA8E9|nr:site-specific integrase [Nesterenkonia populi]
MTKRRSNHEGTGTYKVSDGRWRSDVTIGKDPVTKKRIRRPVYGRTSAECAANRRKLLREVEDNKVVLTKPPTLAEWLHHWLEKIQRPGLEYQTWEGYESSIRNHMLPSAIASSQLDKITAKQIEDLYASMRKSGLRAGTVRQTHSILSVAFKEALKRDKIAVNPMDKVSRPVESKDEVFRPKVLTSSDARKIMKAADELPLEQGVRWMFSLSYGPRQSEVLGLGWDCVDFDNAKIDLKRKLYARKFEHGCNSGGPVCGKKPQFCPERTGGGLFFGVPKSESGFRSYPLPGELKEKMQALWAKHIILCEQEGERRQPYRDPNGVEVDLVFCQRNGRPYQPSNDSSAWKRFIERTGVDAVRLHDARHTSATMLLELGVQPRVVMEIMGWSNMAMLNRYQHALDDVKKDTADKLSAALWG